MDIIIGIEIETTAQKLFEALTTATGIAAWWTKAKTQTAVGAINEFAFGQGTVTFRVDKLEPNKAVAWTAEAVPPDWKGTRVRFELSEGARAGSVTLRFSHAGFATMTPVVAFTNYAWAQFLRSLKLFLE
ncbi:MAG TPA: SRPBCC domain-containing protein, partial [Polyangia bacterium]